LFEGALDLAGQLSEDFYAVDALHMLAIIVPEESIELNRQAIQLAEQARDERARGWLGSLYNNTGWSLHDRGDYAPALEMFEKAEALRRLKGNADEVRIAVWCVARALRSLNRLKEALSRQRELKKEYDSVGEKDGYVFEELGECLLALGRGEEARPWFAEAYELLSQDAWLAEREPGRLARLKSLGEEAAG
jgi:tetratricopeptide (TPR) repeat protein